MNMLGTSASRDITSWLAVHHLDLSESTATFNLKPIFAEFFAVVSTNRVCDIEKRYKGLSVSSVVCW